MRGEVAAYLQRNAANFRDFQSDGWEQYLQQVGSNAWGDHLTLLAMSNMFGVRFEIVSDRASGDHIHQVAGPEARGQIIVIAHYHERHYESTAALNGADGVLQ